VLWNDGLDLAWLEDAETGVALVGTGPRVRAADWEAAMASLPAGAAASEPGLGWVGWIDFPWMLGALGLDAAGSDPRFLRVRGALRFGGGAARWIQEPDDAPEPSERALALARLAATVPGAAADGGRGHAASGSGTGTGTVASGVPGAGRFRHDAAGYLAAVEAAKAAIAEGEAYVVCLTTAVDAPGRWDGLETFLALRAAAPTRHLALIRIGDTCLVAASPERFLHLDADGIAATAPIKGTRPRDAEPGRDAELAAELAADPKERAENLMVVDVARNDLARVCVPGTVTVRRFREVESYRTVHQLVSEVAGRVQPGTSVAGVLAALAPGTSMTGAPKRSASSIALGLERGGRGVYSGAYGWIGAGGCAELSMSIRCAVIGPDTAMIGVGGGITADSDPAAEWAEARLKARATLAALRGPR